MKQKEKNLFRQDAKRIVQQINKLPEEEKQKFCDNAVEKYTKLLLKIEDKKEKVEALKNKPRNYDLVQSAQALTSATMIVVSLILTGIIAEDKMGDISSVANNADAISSSEVLAGIILIGAPLGLINLVAYLQKPVGNLVVKTRMRLLVSQLKKLEKQEYVQKQLIDELALEE